MHIVIVLTFLVSSVDSPDDGRGCSPYRSTTQLGRRGSYKTSRGMFNCLMFNNLIIFQCFILFIYTECRYSVLTKILKQKKQLNIYFLSRLFEFECTSCTKNFIVFYIVF